MDERNINSLRRVHNALEQKGFSRLWQRQGNPTYSGQLSADGQTFTVTIEIPDLDFVSAPIICFVDAQKIRDQKILPHITGPDGQICYLDMQMAVLDRYKPEGTVIWCLNRVEDVVSKTLRGKLNEDIEEEFFAYWSSSPIFIDLPAGFDREAKIFLVKWHPQKESSSWVISHKNKIAGCINFFARNSADNIEFGSCVILRISNNLSVDAGVAWPPATFARLIEWLRNTQPQVISRIEEAIRNGSEELGFWFALMAPNCSAVFNFKIPPELRKVEFLQTRRVGLFSALLINGEKIKIDRYSGQAIDENYIFKRNVGHMKNLSGKKIALVGCGTIGGFLAQYLAQSGAGIGETGDLTLIDKDAFSPQNLGRHLLGSPYISQNKAEACKEFLEQQLPYVKISALPLDVQTCRDKLLKYDLVIDATGEEALSIALNDFIVRQRPKSPPTLFVRLVGNGSAAQTIFCPGEGYACFKCEKPELAGQERHQVMRKETKIIHEKNLPCGDATHIPFPVSRSVTAAALGLEVALNWANNDPRPHFRSRVLDSDQAKNAIDNNPLPSAHCPICKQKQRST